MSRNRVAVCEECGIDVHTGTPPKGSPIQAGVRYRGKWWCRYDRRRDLIIRLAEKASCGVTKGTREYALRRLRGLFRMGIRPIQEVVKDVKTISLTDLMKQGGPNRPFGGGR